MTCGAAEVLSAVSEPSRCLYAAKLTTPAMCTKEEQDRLQVSRPAPRLGNLVQGPQRRQYSATAFPCRQRLHCLLGVARDTREMLGRCFCRRAAQRARISFGLGLAYSVDLAENGRRFLRSSLMVTRQAAQTWTRPLSACCGCRRRLMRHMQSWTASKTSFDGW